MRGISNDAFPIIFQFDKSICCWYSFELPRPVEAIQMSSATYAFIKKKIKVPGL